MKGLVRVACLGAAVQTRVRGGKFQAPHVLRHSLPNRVPAVPLSAARASSAPGVPHHSQVVDMEKYFVFEFQPGALEWRVLEEACLELDKLAALIDGKIKVRGGRDGRFCSALAC